MNDLIEKSQEVPTVHPPTYANVVEGYQSALKVVDDLIMKNYISGLSEMEVVPLSKSILQTNIRDNVRFFKITEIVYEQNEVATYKFASVFNALSSTNSTIFIIIDSDGAKTDFYMGVRSLDEIRTISSLKNTLENALKGQFPGIKTCDDYTVEDAERLLNGIKARSISSVSCVANNKSRESSSNQSFLQGLEKLIISMQGEKYTGIIIANGTSQSQLKELRKNYEMVYTQLSALATTQVNYTGNNSFSYSMAETQGNSKANSHTENHTISQGKSISNSNSLSHSESQLDDKGKLINGISAASSLIGTALAPATRGTSLFIGGAISGGLGLLGSVISKNISDTISSSQSVSANSSSSKGVSNGVTDTISYGTSQTEGYTNGTSEGMTLTVHDKSIEDILERINKQLKRIDEFESLGMYECAAYFLSDNQYSAEIAASTYKALMCGENSGVEIAAVNSWGQSQREKTEIISQYVKNFIHPVFNYIGPAGNIEVTPCSLVSGNELAIHMGLPRRSVCGLPVIEHTNFGKEVVVHGNKKISNNINLGKIYNMGSVGENNVSLDFNSLSMHTFVTGSTGSGKSNTVYEMIRQLDNNGINYLIVEPAKGEYKNAFGMYPDVHVYGTNPRYTDILKINPFKFPDGIHILEHIDRLIEIFNVCWPMYAAMPAVLKDAVLQAYESCGWNLTESENRYSNNLFPTFTDLFTELEIVIRNSSYSDEVKSNYSGSLTTRIKSLTNGLNGQIFSSNEIDNTELFDKKVIIDISRVGSSETKSLIMGILIMRISEHRMSYCKETNSPLRHVTILEEAHNILKRTSSEQNAEGSNVAGKSVEMISNAIAEMRTYGEGFIIADQSPNAVDISAIRNTNTKIIMRLPDENDRRLVGKAAGLKDIQLDEISKLPKGVAVVYQNDWIEPVLCKIEKFKGEERPFRKKADDLSFVSSYEHKKSLIRNLLNKISGENLDTTISELTSTLIEMEIPTKVKIAALGLIRTNGNCTADDISTVIYALVCNPSLEKEAENVDSIEEWRNVFVYSKDSIISDFDTNTQNIIVECILREQIKRYNKSDEYLTIWNRFLKGEVI